MWDTIGHEWLITLLERAVRGGHLAHTYLFAGQKGVGKTHLARRLAAMLNCTGGSIACGDCSTCTRIAHDAHPDVRVVRPDDGRVKIDQVRSLQHDLSLSPYEGRWRVAILTEFERATPEAANALLKTLEEPPSKAVLVLTASDPSLLLPTVVSRCQVLAVRGVRREVIARALVERWRVEDEQAQFLAALSGGRVGWAIRAATDPEALRRREEDLRTLRTLLAGGWAERILAAEELAQRDDLPELLRLWQSWWRDLLLLCGGNGDGVANLDHVDVLRAQAAASGLRVALRGTRGIEAALKQMDQNVNPRLTLEVLLMSWPVGLPAGA